MDLGWGIWVVRARSLGRLVKARTFGMSLTVGWNSN